MRSLKLQFIQLLDSDNKYKLAANPTQLLRTDRVEKEMVDKTEISNAVTIKSDSADRVAFDLMKLIADAENQEGGYFAENQRNRSYWIKLYEQSKKIVKSNFSAEDVIALKKD